METFKIMLFEPFRFDKAAHQKGDYQPRWGLFLMERLFQQKDLLEFEIRESSADNDPPGFAFVERVRGEYMLPYHLPECFGGQDFNGSCVCGHGRTRAPA
ncbi:hypothetical protein LRS71_24460 [Rhodococcus pyridinivorans]|uniref:hypothetical protein n=1 Tax=Rhodococcus pyridinivorans TaxID=103816 RepID=UPI001E538747|nr:hypothetical protein [Rhodococcus pyridinivorans]MCD5422667.1 hypothetical protein [Rhodococcus pyridinivorans]